LAKIHQLPGVAGSAVCWVVLRFAFYTSIIMYAQAYTIPYDSVAVDSGQAALDQMDLYPVPLLITDFSMPRMNGVELIEAVKQLFPRHPRGADQRLSHRGTRATGPRCTG
jgi:CheY-like chemotaxis protein